MLNLKFVISGGGEGGRRANAKFQISNFKTREGSSNLNSDSTLQTPHSKL
jgi:hypothetical protein